MFLRAVLAGLVGAFRYTGRSDRFEHWAFSFFTAVIVVGGVILYELGVAFRGPILLGTLVIAVWLILSHVALFVRRLHDQNRSGMFMLIPAAGVSLMLVGWLGSNGYIDFRPGFFMEYGVYIILAGRAVSVISVSLLVSIFIAEGDSGENRFGEPVL